MNVMRTGALLFDGASRKQALVWLSQTYPEHSQSPLLYNTQYEALGDIGPVLLDADEDSRLYLDWLNGSGELQQAVWLKTSVCQNELYTSLRRRLRVRSPAGREYWLRLADARPLSRAWQAGATWPEGFWYGVSEVWLQYQGCAHKAWDNPTPLFDCSTPVDGIAAQITLDWLLLAGLSHKDATAQEALL